MPHLIPQIKTNRNPDRNGERGNVLFLILIAVALFAALSYAVTQSSRSGGSESTGEKSLISGAQVTQYPAGVRTSIVRMLIDNNTDVTLLEFNAPSDFSTLTLVNGKYSRGVFHPDGGGATYQSAPADIMNSGAPGKWYYNAEFSVPLIGTTASDASGNDLTAFLPKIKLTVCQKINDQLGIVSSPPPTVATTLAAIDKTQGTGTGYTAFPTTVGTVITTGLTPDPLSGQPFGCFKDTAGDYIYYHVMLER